MANEKEQLPVWLSSGIEPPQSLKENGWQAGVKPPAQYMDWFFNRTYMVLKQLQESGGANELIGDITQLSTQDKTNIVQALNEMNTKKVNTSDKATIAEAEAGTNDTKYMTPLKTTESILTLFGSLVATQTNAVAGTANDKIMTPLRVSDVTGKLSALQTTNKTNIVQAVNEVKAGVTQHLEQNEYQTATISGTQIRLAKQSNSNRLFLKLNTNLSGSITVSTDSGTTSKNLVDIDGNPVTSLEKGFHEIVLTGNFFTLRNRGLSPADLQALITITNEAEANESALRMAYINQVNALEVLAPLTADATWNQILLKLPEVKSSKKEYKTGEVTSETPNRTHNYYDDSGSTTYPTVQIDYSTLGFVPSKVLIRRKNTPGSVLGTNYYKKFGTFVDYVNMVNVSVNLTNYATSIGFKFGNYCYVNDTGFRLPVSNGGTTYVWEAYE